ncbi:hypothetical protein ACHAWF_006158 [Thalassiosira exigua]
MMWPIAVQHTLLLPCALALFPTVAPFQWHRRISLSSSIASIQRKGVRRIDGSLMRIGINDDYGDLTRDVRGGEENDRSKSAPAAGPSLPTRREVLIRSAAAIVGASTGATSVVPPSLASGEDDGRGRYVQRFPTLFDPLYGPSERVTILRGVSPSVWALEQSLILGPLETPLRCVVVRLRDGSLWVHAPLAPTDQFFDLVESCGNKVSHVVVPTYALEHKIFAKDALERWPDAELWTSPGQFSFPSRSASDEFVWGRKVDGVLGQSDLDEEINQPPWIDEIQYETLAAGTFNIGGKPTTLYETTFFHRSSRTLIVTDAVAKIPREPPPLNRVENLLLVSKRSTSNPLPEDTAESRRIGWRKTVLLVSYFFPEHEELDPARFGVVTWTDGWEDNFADLAERTLLVPPVVRTLLYAQDPRKVKEWVERATERWDFETIVPAHWEAPIAAGPGELRNAFRFLEDETVGAFPEEDLRRGLRPLAELASNALGGYADKQQRMQ